MWDYLKRLLGATREPSRAIWSATDGVTVYTLWAPLDYTGSLETHWRGVIEDLAAGRCEVIGLPPYLKITTAPVPGSPRRGE